MGISRRVWNTDSVGGNIAHGHMSRMDINKRCDGEGDAAFLDLLLRLYYLLSRMLWTRINWMSFI